MLSNILSRVVSNSLFLPSNSSISSCNSSILSFLDWITRVILSVVSLSGISGGLLANVNRWRGQINLDPISENQILEFSESGESKMGAFRIFKMVNNLNKEKAIIAAVLPTGNKTFFIKLTVSQQGLRELESVFEKFCSSIGS